MGTTDEAAAGPFAAPAAKVYRLAELEPLPDAGLGFERRVVVGEHLMIMEARLPAGTVVPTHSHAQEQLSYVISGRVRLWSGPNEEERVLEPGDVAHIPGDVPHGVEILEDTHGFDFYSPPRLEILG